MAKGLFNRIVLAVVLVLGLLGPAAAQAPIPSVIEDLKLVSEDAEQAAFMLRFSPEVPRMEPQNAIPGARAGAAHDAESAENPLARRL